MSKEVLYRKYRSQNFREIIGQETVVNILKQAILEDRLGHAYLFSGPRGTGKTSLARVLAKALNCNNLQDGEPCNECTNCIAIAEGRFLDLIEIDAASNRGIDEIRDLREKVNFLPVDGKVKVYIIDEVHMLTKEAFNALLKTLEEPPPNVVFILATTEPHKIPATIISRTQRFDFKMASETSITEKLEVILKGEEMEIDSEAVLLIARAGGGSFRDAETVLEKVIGSVESTNNKKISISLVEDILGVPSWEIVENLVNLIFLLDRQEVMLLSESVFQKGYNLDQLIKQVLEYARIEMTKVMNQEESKYDLRFLVKIVQEFGSVNESMKFSLLPIATFQARLISLINDLDDSETEKEVTPKNVKKPIKKKKSKVTVVKQEIKNINHEQKDEKEPQISKSQVDSLQEEQKKLDVDNIILAWQKIVGKAKMNNPHLAAFLVKSKPTSCNGTKLILSVPFTYHKKKLESAKIQKKFAKMSEEVLGLKLQLECNVNKAMAKISKEEDPSNENMVEEVFADII